MHQDEFILYSVCLLYSTNSNLTAIKRSCPQTDAFTVEHAYYGIPRDLKMFPFHESVHLTHVVGRVTVLLAGHPGFDFRHGRIFIFATTGSETHPISHLVGTKVPSSGLERPGREADDSPPFSADVKMHGVMHS
jgi:hypothetical protein